MLFPVPRVLCSLLGYLVFLGALSLPVVTVVFLVPDESCDLTEHVPFDAFVKRCFSCEDGAEPEEREFE